MAKLKSNEVLQTIENGVTPMTVVYTMTELERTTIAAKAEVAEKKQTRQNLDVRIKAAHAAVEEAVEGARLLKAEIAGGGTVSDEAITAAAQKADAARSRLAILKEAIPDTTAALVAAQRALFVPLVAELRSRLGATLQRQVHLQELTEANNARFAGIKRALDMNELFYVEAVLAEYPPLPELAPALTAAAE